jgi:Zn-dependent peptidase ImmA (M78 family)
MARGRRAWIRKEALRALALAGATGPDQIDPVRTAKVYDIDVAYGGITGAAERISMVGGRARIRISDAIVQPGRRAFTLVHGIGHKVCGHTIARDGDVEGWIRSACGRRGSVEEREADVFATEHLTPEPWVRPYCTTPTVDLDAVHTIARVFPVSPVMAAMRYVELTDHACAVVYAERGQVKWFKGSRAFPGRIERGAHVPERSSARAYFDSGVISDAAHPLAACAWLPWSQRIEATTELIEHEMIVPEPGWGGVLVILWIPAVASQTSWAATSRDSVDGDP